MFYFTKRKGDVVEECIWDSRSCISIVGFVMLLLLLFCFRVILYSVWTWCARQQTGCQKRFPISKGFKNQRRVPCPLKGTRHTWYSFLSQVVPGKQLLWLPFCFSARHAPFENGLLKCCKPLLLLKKSLNKTKSPSFLSVVSSLFQKAIFFDVY